MSEDTKQKILTAAVTEIPLIRYASRYFDRRHNLDEMKSYAEAAMTRFNIQPKHQSDIIDMMVRFSKLHLDQFETSLLVATCILSPDRGLRTSADSGILSIAQEMAIQLLRLKIAMENKPVGLMASIMGFVTQLRNFALIIQPEWQKYIYHSTKVFLDGHVPKEKVRIGINYLAQFEPNHL